MGKRCGDLAAFRYKVAADAVGSTAATKVRRVSDDDLAAACVETLAREESKKVRWPDLAKADGGFFGGRQTDLKGLNKLPYRGKFERQRFSLGLFVGGREVRSSGGPLKINGYDDILPEHKQTGFPMATELWEQGEIEKYVGGPRVLARVQRWKDPTTMVFQPGRNVGDFHLSVRDGVIYITVKIDPWCERRRWSRRRVLAAIKHVAERFWNGSANGFRQWVWHREKCERRARCNCKVVMNGKHVYKQAGCCKLPVQVIVEDGPDNRVQIHYLTPEQKRQLKVQGYVDRLRADTLNFYYPENNPGTYAHEIGHMIGFPDQYWSGVTATGALDRHGFPSLDGGPFPIDDESIMGQTMTKAKPIHFKAAWFHSWIDAHVDRMKALGRQ